MIRDKDKNLYFVRRAHDTDPPISFNVINCIKYDTTCIHCGKHREPKEVVTYTQLSNGKLIWWHSHRIKDYD